MKKALFLYTELADYTISGFKALSEKDVEIHVVRWPVNREAPFDFSKINGITFYERNDYNDEGLNKLIEDIQPDLIYSAGWMDKGYLKACRKTKVNAIRIIGLDNKWTGAPRQYLASLLSRLTIRPVFDIAFVPGSLQKKYARKLGFRENEIVTGLYTANTIKFNQVFKEQNEAKRTAYPKRFIYVGRYVHFKGVYDLWEAFMEMKKEQPENKWELWCIGTGELFDQKIEHPAIKHFGFVQPDEIGTYLKDAGVYVLPSHKEPWAVSVHEMAAAGMPLICSNEVGAVEEFLISGENGFIFQAGNASELKGILKKVSALPDDELIKMSEKSHQLSTRNSPEKWSQKVLDMMKTKKHVRN